MGFTFAMAIATLVATAGVGQAAALTFDNIDFPQGQSSFADAVIRYEPLYGGGPKPTAPSYVDPSKALGTPNYVNAGGSVAIGRGGLLELAFTDNVLTNSGSSMQDLHIFEVGGDIEHTYVAVRPTSATLSLITGIGLDANSDGFFEIGMVDGSTSSIDLDDFFPGFGSGVLKFDAVQLIDVWSQGDITGSTVGADIDAVGAISSQAIFLEAPVVAVSNPEPATAILSLLATLGLAGLATRRRVS
jgi:hypothetical protein